MKWFRATVTKTIHWHGRPYRIGDQITLNDADKEHLRRNNAIGDISVFDRKQERKEFSVKEAPENAMKPHKRNARKKMNN